jgi:hypothetical protein
MVQQLLLRPPPPLLLLLLSAPAVPGSAGLQPVDFPILWDISVGLPAAAVAAMVPSLVNATPRVQLDKIIECPHPCGLLPYIGPNGQPCDPKTAEYGCNGELPQGPGFNLTKHLDTLQKTLDRWIPVAADQWFDIDFEGWGPVWNRLPDDDGAQYQNASIALVKTAHPDWSEEQLLAEATKQWEAASMKLLLETIAFVKKIRPKLKVALYCYPMREYYDGYNTSSGDALRADNDRAMDLYCATDGIFPSVYQFYDSTGKPSTRAANEEYVFTNVQEAVRIAGEVPAKCSGKKKPPVWVYTWCDNHSMPPQATHCKIAHASDLTYYGWLPQTGTGTTTHRTHSCLTRTRQCTGSRATRRGRPAWSSGDLKRQSLQGRSLQRGGRATSLR